MQRQQGKGNAVSQRASRKIRKSTATNSTASTADVPGTSADDSDVSDVTADEPQTEVTRLKNANEDIDSNICCMCFQSWHDDVLEGGGTECVSCNCGRWMHEDCIEDVVTDSDGFKHFCSFCIDKYSV